MLTRRFLETRRALVIVISLFVYLITGTVHAWAQTTIPLASLPAPPAELKRWIDEGRVTFQFGTSQAETDAAASATQDDGNTAFNDKPGNRFAAETHFRIQFDYDARIGWRHIENRKELRITFQLRRFGWQPSHTVWFRDRPEANDFWSNPLVLHEFDHIRLSTNPRMKARFDELLREPGVIRHRLDAGEIGNQRLARRLVDEHLQGMHQELLELIRIRYQELDRATSHGGAPLLQDSPLYELLREKIVR